MNNGNLKTISEIKDLEAKRNSLCESIRILGITLSELEETVKNHEGNKAVFETLSSNIENLKSKSSFMKDAIDVSQHEINSLLDKKNTLVDQSTQLQSFIEQNQLITKEIENNSAELRRIQDEIIKFNLIKNELISSTKKIKDDINTAIKVASNSLPKQI